MSSMNVTATQRIYGDYARGVMETLYAALSPDVEWHAVGRPSDFPVLGRRRGIAAVREFVDIVAKSVEFSVFSPDEFYATGDKVFVLGHYAMTIRKTGRKIASEFAHIFTFRNGKLVQFREFLDTAQLAEAYRS